MQPTKIPSILRCGLLLPALLLSFCLSAQPGKTKKSKTVKDNSNEVASTTTSTSPTLTGSDAPVARNMKAYAKTPQGIARQKKFEHTFGDANGEIAKTIPFPDNSSLKVKMVKNPAWANMPDAVKADMKHKDKDKPDHTPDGKGGQWTCVTDHISLTASSITFMNNDYSGKSSHIYPGAIFTYDNFNNGAYTEQTGDRYPLTIVTDNTNVKGKPYVTVSDPNMATVRAAVDNLFKESTGPVANQSLSYQIFQSYNEADQSLMLGGGASGYGVTLQAGFSTTSDKKTVNMTIDAVRTLFSINTVPPDSGFYKEASIENTPNLMVIGSVTYGVRVLANFTVSFDTEDEAAQFRASYSGFGVSANFNFDDISNNKSVSSTINCYVIGGTSKSTVVFDKKDLKNQIQKIMNSVDYKNAMPISCELYDMAGEVVGTNSISDDFAVRQCTESKDDPRLESVYVTFATAAGDGGNNRNADDNFTLYLYPGNVQINVAKDYLGGVFDYGSASYPQQEYPAGSTNTVKMGWINKEVRYSDFQKNGGALKLQIFPNGNDNWVIGQMSIQLNFEGNVIAVKPITYSNITMSNDSYNNTWQIFYFDNSFAPRGQ